MDIRRFFTVIPIYLRLPIILILTWELCVRGGWWPSTIIAPPSVVVIDFFNLLFNGTLKTHILASIGRLLAGFLIGSVFAVLIGTWIGLSRFAEKLLQPTFTVLSPMPPVAWIPLLIAIFGIGEISKIMLIALGTFFIVLFGTINGIRGTDSRLIELANVYQKTKKELVQSILIPSATPVIISNMRIALALSWILLIAAEVVASDKGLGWLIWDGRNFSRPDDMIVGMITVGLLGKLTDQAMLALEQYLLRWRQVFEGI
jgi:ABC-type nitrate/sulfonate/bicarbonate transport system permease component